ARMPLSASGTRPAHQRCGASSAAPVIQAMTSITALASPAAMDGSSEAPARGPRASGYATKRTYGTAPIVSQAHTEDCAQIEGWDAVITMATWNGTARTASRWRPEIHATARSAPKRTTCSAITTQSGG